MAGHSSNDVQAVEPQHLVIEQPLIQNEERHTDAKESTCASSDVQGASVNAEYMYTDAVLNAGYASHEEMKSRPTKGKEQKNVETKSSDDDQAVKSQHYLVIKQRLIQNEERHTAKLEKAQ